MGTEHVGTMGLACSSEGLKKLPDVHEGFLGVCRIPLGLVFPKQIIVVPFLPQSLKIHLVNDLLVNEVQAWTMVTLDLMEKDKAC